MRSILDSVSEHFPSILRRPDAVGRNLVFLEFHGTSLVNLGGPAGANDGKLDGAEAGGLVDSCLSRQSCQDTPRTFSKWRYGEAMETLEIAPVVHVL